MKKLFFFFLLANFLVFLGARFLVLPPADENERRSGGNIVFLLSADLEAYLERAGQHETGDEHPVPPTSPAPETPQEAAGSREQMIRNLELDDAECLALGPLDARDKADALAGDLAQQNLAAIVRTDVTTETRSHLVLISIESPDEAAEMMRKLNEAGHKDVWKLDSGEQKGQVSVGLFRNKANAETRQRQMLADGFPATVVPRETERRTYWVDLRSVSSREIKVEFLDALRETYPGVSAERNRCPHSPL